MVLRPTNSAALLILEQCLGCEFLEGRARHGSPKLRLAQEGEMQKLSARVNKLLHNSKQAQKVLTFFFLRKSKLKLQ